MFGIQAFYISMLNSGEYRAQILYTDTFVREHFMQYRLFYSPYRKCTGLNAVSAMKEHLFIFKDTLNE